MDDNKEEKPRTSSTRYFAASMAATVALVALWHRNSVKKERRIAVREEQARQQRTVATSADPSKKSEQAA
jgi:hypothetical protein